MLNETFSVIFKHCAWRILISNLQATKTKIQTTKKNKSESNEVIKSQNSWGATMDWFDVELVCRDHLNWYCQKTLVEESFIFFLFLNYGGDETSKVSYFVVRQESYNCATYSNQKNGYIMKVVWKKTKKSHIKITCKIFPIFLFFFFLISNNIFEACFLTRKLILRF